MSEQEFRRALGYANSAMDLLKRGQIPPYPQFYELLYTYATGVNPSLNQRHQPDLPRRHRRRPNWPSGSTTNSSRRRTPTSASPASPSAWRSASKRCTTPSIPRWRRRTPIPARCSRRAATSHSEMPEDELRGMAQRLLGETRRMQDANHAARAEARGIARRHLGAAARSRRGPPRVDARSADQDLQPQVVRRRHAEGLRRGQGRAASRSA